MFEGDNSGEALQAAAHERRVTTDGTAHEAMVEETFGARLLAQNV